MVDVFEDLGIGGIGSDVGKKEESTKKIESWIPNDNPEFIDLDAKKPEWDEDAYRRVARLFLGSKYEYKIHIGKPNDGYIFYISPPTFQEDLSIRVKSAELRGNSTDVELNNMTYALAVLDTVVRKIYIVKGENKSEQFKGKFFDLIEKDRNPEKVYGDLVFPLYRRYTDIKELLLVDDEILKK